MTSSRQKTLNFEENGGEDKNDNNKALNKDGAPQPLNSVNPGDKETEVEEEQEHGRIGQGTFLFDPNTTFGGRWSVCFAVLGTG